MVLFSAFAVAALRAEVEFSGYMQTGSGEVRFVLADSVAKTKSGWLAVGGEFAGYRVTAFDAKAETLVVMREGTSLRLPLRAAGLHAGEIALAEPPDPRSWFSQYKDTSEPGWVTLTVRTGKMPLPDAPAGSLVGEPAGRPLRIAVEHLADPAVAIIVSELMRNEITLVMRQTRQARGETPSQAPETLEAKRAEIEQRLAAAKSVVGKRP